MRQRLRRPSLVLLLICGRALDVAVQGFLDCPSPNFGRRTVGRRLVPTFRVVHVRRNPTDSDDPSLHSPNAAPGDAGSSDGTTNDPRVYRKLLRQEQSRQRIQDRQRALRQEAEKRKQAAQALDLPKQPLVETIGGGTAMIFEMARQMMLWGEPSTALPPSGAGAPRWHPTTGISDANPSFRTSAPVMSNQGYAGTIWRNARKDRPSQWRYALRTYDRTADAERNGTVPVAAPTSATATTQQQQAAVSVQRTNVHHEGALLACSKLGLWQRALEIYHQVEDLQLKSGEASGASNSTATSGTLLKPMSSASAMSAARSTSMSLARQKSLRRAKAKLELRNHDDAPGDVYVTEAMLLSVIRACVRASRQLRKESGTSTPGTAATAVDHESKTSHRAELLQRSRAPLDAAVSVLERLVSASSTVSVDFPVVARHVNPIAAAYQSLGLNADASHVLTVFLANRTIGPEGEDGNDPLNVHDLKAKDKASYSLLVQGAVTEGDFTAAVDALRVMTEAGLYPNQRHLNAWTEISERKTKHRTTRSWTKKRDEFWLESVR